MVRNAVTAAPLVMPGTEASEGALDGPNGLFAIFHRNGMQPEVRFFDGQPEIAAV